MQAYPAVTVLNRDFEYTSQDGPVPFQAVIEFKLDNQGWSAGHTRGAIAELGKLRLSTEAPLRYFVVLMRYTAPTLTRWRRYWERVKAVAEQEPGIGNVFAMQWLGAQGDVTLYRCGAWSNLSDDCTVTSASE